MLVGLGCEIFIGTAMVKYMNTSPLIRLLWNFAQLLFPLMLSIAVVSRSPFGLPFAVFGLFKFGFPEVTGHILAGLLDDTLDDVSRVCEFMNGIFMLSHHASSIMVICGLVTGLWPLNQLLVGGIFPVIVQHWFALLKYYGRWPYIAAMLIVEVWFEIEFFGGFSSLHDPNLEWTLLFMMAAHWGMFFVGAIELLIEICEWKSWKLSSVDGNKLREKPEQPTEEVAKIRRSSTLRKWHRAFTIASSSSSIPL
jgi:hypothetical protein